MNLTSGPATKSCQKKAIGKFLTTSSQNVANICELKPPLKRMVAIKLIIGHINQIEKTEIARIIAIGLSFPDVTILKAHFGKWSGNECIENKTGNNHDRKFA